MVVKCFGGWGGRYFSRRLIDYTSSLPEKGKVKMSQQAITDIRWWKKCMETFNGKASIRGSRGFCSDNDRGEWVCVRFWGKAIHGIIKFEHIKEPGIVILSPVSICIIIPEYCKDKPSILEFTIMILGLQRIIQSKGWVVTVCCNWKNTESMLRSAKYSYGLVLKYLHELF